MRWLHKFLTFALCLVAVPSWAQQIQQTTLTADETILAGQVIELDGTNLNLADSAADIVVGVAALGATSGQTLFIRSSGIVTCPCEVGAAANEYLSPGAVAGSGNAGSAAPTATSFGYILGGRDGSGNCRILFGRFIVQAGAVTSLDDLSDVTITGPLTTNDGLIYDGANYVDEPIDFNQLANTDIASLTIGDIYFVNGSNNITRLPIGSAGEELTVAGGLPVWGIGGQGGAVVISVEKETAGTINVGEVVHLTGNTAGVIEVELAQADAAGTMPAIGIAAETITDSVAGNVVVIGTTNGLNTSAFSEGDILYVSDSVAGGLTGTKPTGTDLIQNMGVVSRSHVTLGELNVGAGRTNDLPNIPQNQLWVGDGSGVPVAVSTLVHEAGGLEVDASLFDGLAHISGGVTTNLTNFNWQNSNSALAIGVAEFDVDVNGTTIDMLFSSHVEGATLIANIAGHTHSDVAGNGSLVYGARSRGTDAAETVIQDNDNLLWLAALGHDGTTYERAAEIWMEVDGTPGNDDMPGRIIFRTTADGAFVPTERLRISADGTILMSNHTFDTSNLTAGVLPEARGGTGQATVKAAIEATPVDYLDFNQQASSPSTPAAGDITLWPSNDTIPRWQFTVPGPTDYGLDRFEANTVSTDWLWLGVGTRSNTTVDINGAVAGQVVTYDTAVNEDTFDIMDGSVGKVWIHNITQAETRMVTPGGFDTAANTLTFHAGEDITAWANNDNLRLAAGNDVNANVTGADVIAISLEDVIPVGTTLILVKGAQFDSGAISATGPPYIGPVWPSSDFKLRWKQQVSGVQMFIFSMYEVDQANNYTIYAEIVGTGAGTMNTNASINGWINQ